MAPAELYDVISLPCFFEFNVLTPLRFFCIDHVPEVPLPHPQVAKLSKMDPRLTAKDILTKSDYNTSVEQFHGPVGGGPCSTRTV